MKIQYSFCVKYNDPITSQFCTCHDSLAVMTCAKLWPDWITQNKIRACNIFIRFHLRAHKPFVKCSPGISMTSRDSWGRETVVPLWYYWQSQVLDPHNEMPTNKSSVLNNKPTHQTIWMEWSMQMGQFFIQCGPLTCVSVSCMGLFISDWNQCQLTAM